MQNGHVRRWSTVPRRRMFVAKQLNAETKKPDNERSERRMPGSGQDGERPARISLIGDCLPTFPLTKRIVFVIRNRVEMRLCLRHELARRI